MTPLLSIETTIQLIKNISKKMEMQHVGLSFNYSIENNRILIKTPFDNKEVVAFRHCMADESRIVGLFFFSDAFILNNKLPRLPAIHFGPGKPQLAHQVDEYCLLNDYFNAIEILIEYTTYTNP